MKSSQEIDEKYSELQNKIDEDLKSLSNKEKELENKFLLGMAWSESYKFQVLEILKIVYNKAAESDEQYAKDYEKIVEMTEKKFEEFGNEWIKNMNEVLGHKTEYKNWKEATKYINEIVNRHKT